MKINSNHTNLSFDQEINSCRNWLQTKTFDACQYPSSVLHDRLLQLIAEKARYPYAQLFNDLRQTGGVCLPPPEAKINYGCAYMEIGTGRIITTPIQWLSNVINFLIHWMYCFVAILAAKQLTGKDSPSVLVYGVGEEDIFQDEGDEQFINYCRQGPIEPLRSGRRFLVQSKAARVSMQPAVFGYARNPLIELVQTAKLGFVGRLLLLLRHLRLALEYLISTIRFPQLSLLGKELAYTGISFELDRHGLIESYVITISSYASQPLWLRGMRRAKVHMVWYAQNFKPVTYASDKTESFIPSLRWVRADTHWVWTHSFAEYLGGLCGNGKIKVVGPIVWRLPLLGNSATTVVNVAIFDISPFSNELALSLGETSNYNHPTNLFSFIRDIISLKSRLEDLLGRTVTFRLKTKRGYKVAYDRAYFDFLEELSVRGDITLEHHTTNIYKLISGSDLVVAYPFTSVAYIAEALNVPAIYFDPTNSLVGHHFGDSNLLINFASSSDELLNYMVTALLLNRSPIRSSRKLHPAEPGTK